MTTQLSPGRLSVASHLTPYYGLLGVMFGGLLLAAATWLGIALRGGLPEVQTGTHHLRVVDAQRAMIFDADRATGDVRVLNVRNGVSEIGRLHEGDRGTVSAIALNAQGTVLTVESAGKRYQYDAHSLHLLRSGPLLAAGQTDGRDM
ncbi:hypothetical protein VVD49_07170 [Uliginosibacterium sp. H3]|uniref:Uncharacterized protein n=1 Tax=Uliginosibacterium silvisoli TaxID=3114758 RepID=A0ABU6K3A2_9RHOO|nr:hypothetical protein [Uliginosibacterium sp. H3]